MTGDTVVPDIPTNAGDTETSASNFRGQVVEICEGYIRQYKRGDIDRIDVVRALSDTIYAKTNTDDVEGLADARKASFANFLDQVDEIARARVDGVLRGRGLARHAQESTRAVPDADARGEEDKEVEGVFERSRSSSIVSHIGHPSKRARSVSPDNTARAGKKPFIEAQLPFLANRQKRLAVTSLHPDLQETLRCKSIYSRDVVASKQVLICQPDCPQLPDPLWTDVLLSRFIDLDRIFSALHSIEGDTAETYKVGDLELSTGPTKPKKHVTTAGQWTSAFERYKEAVLFCYPHRDRELSSYTSHIVRHFAAVGEAGATRVINYDRAVRAEASRGNQFLLTDFHEWNHMYTAYIVSSAGSGASTSGSSSTTQSRRTRDKRSTEACQRYNQGRCTNNTNCRFRHTCVLCGSKEHGLTDCPKRSDDRQRK